MKTKLRIKFSASSFRKLSGSTPLEETILRVFEKLGTGGFAAWILGGFALQEYGYQRYTNDIDLVVDHLEEAREYLSIRGFKPVTGNRFKLIDRVNGVEVELLPGGKSLSLKQLPLPMPKEVSFTPKYLSLHDLLVNKLDSYLDNPIHRAKDLGDVVELLKINKVNKDYLKDSRPDITQKFQEIWEGLH
jgi:hypothetical protein